MSFTKREKLFIGAAFAVLLLTFVTFIIGFILFNPTSDKIPEWRERWTPKKSAPSDYFIFQRAYPQANINIPAYRDALKQAKKLRADFQGRDDFFWSEAGPSNIGGRITDMAVHPSNPSVIYIGAAAGGVLKSVDGGVSWTPVFDEAGALSIGAITIDPNNPDIIWVGTGEANVSADSYPGDGIWRSTDGGQTWELRGLEESSHIGRIAIDPNDSNKIFAAATGALWGTNPERGVYRSTNGGVDWERMLYLTDSTAAIDVVINPANPRIVYAAMWERIRHPDARNVGGMTSGIWRSTDGGDDWDHLTTGLPPSAEDIGRIGLAISPTDPLILYAIYCDHPGDIIGVWKTIDGGDNWAEVANPGNSLYSGFGWYFGGIYVDPADQDRVFVLGVPLKRTVNGGGSWQTVSNYDIHVDHHAFWINPNNTNQIYCGNDGGFYESTNGGDDWVKRYDLHISQFYAIEIDNTNPFRLYGGTQDNGTLRTMTGALDDWDMIYGGDGFYTVVDFARPNIIFAEYQWGGLGKSTNTGFSFSGALEGIDSDDRRNWSTPVVMDPSDNNVLYYGTYRLYKTTNSAEFWNPISEDLTNGIPTGYTYHTITTIAVAPTDNQVIYVGTDDGLVWVTQNGGTDWLYLSGDLPDRWITRVAVSPQDAGIAYVTLSGYRSDDYLPHVFRTTNYGQNWDDISSNLPEAPVNVILEDPEFPEKLYVGTDFGPFYSGNSGGEWEPMGTDIPMVPVVDMKLHNGERFIIAGTHGRSMYKSPLDSVSTGISDLGVNVIPEQFALYKPYPNPFNSVATLKYSIGRAGHVSITVFDAEGRQAASLTDKYHEAGIYEVRFNAEGLASGVYFAKMQTNRLTQVRKMTFLK